MSKTTKSRSSRAIPTRMTLADTGARSLMTANPLSVRETASVKEAAAILTDSGYSALPVVNDAGRPVGVLSRADLVRYAREDVSYREVPVEKRPPGYQVEAVSETEVNEIMTPMVFSVRPEASSITVVEEMLARKVHRLFVVDDSGILIGVISAVDVLRHLRRKE